MSDALLICPQAAGSLFCFAGEEGVPSSRALYEKDRFVSFNRGTVGIWFVDAERRLVWLSLRDIVAIFMFVSQVRCDGCSESITCRLFIRYYEAMWLEAVRREWVCLISRGNGSRRELNDASSRWSHHLDQHSC